MRLFLLTRREGCPESSLGGYDQYEGFVVSAETPGKARDLVYRHSGMNAVSEKFEESRAESVWKDGTVTSCKMIGQPTTRSLNEISQVILADYHAG